MHPMFDPPSPGVPFAETYRRNVSLFQDAVNRPSYTSPSPFAVPYPVPVTGPSLEGLLAEVDSPLRPYLPPMPQHGVRCSTSEEHFSFGAGGSIAEWVANGQPQACHRGTPTTIPWLELFSPIGVGHECHSPSWVECAGCSTSPKSLLERCGVQPDRVRELSLAVDQNYARTRTEHHTWRRTQAYVVPDSAKGIHLGNIPSTPPAIAQLGEVDRLAPHILKSAHHPPQPSTASPLLQCGTIAQGHRLKYRTSDGVCAHHEHNEKCLREQYSLLWAAQHQAFAEANSRFPELRK